MRKIGILLLAATVAAGCKENDTTTYEGKDNHIASFALTRDGVTYNAVISQNQITVTVPYNVSLSGATVTCELAENASIQPNPSSISDWEMDRLFLVTSLNQTDRTYFYTVKYANVVSAGNVTFNTQLEVADFVSTGISAIEGNLTIGSRASDDPVKDLGGLKNIVSVGNNLIIGDFYAGQKLVFKDKTGLANLKEVHGNITLAEGNTTLTDFSLSSLERITGNLALRSKTLTTVEMPALERIGGSLEILSDALLLMTADLLSQVDGDMTLAGSVSGTANAPCDYFYFPALRTIAGDLSLAYFGNLANTGIIFPELTEAKDISYTNLPKANSLAFPKGETLGNIALSDCPAMTEVSLPQLTAAGGLAFRNTTLISKIDCPKLTALSGALSLDRMVAFTGLKTAFPQLASIGGDLYMNELSALEGTLDLSEYTFAPKSTITLQGMTLGKLQKIAGPKDFSGKLYINGAGLSPTPETLPFEISGFESVGAFHLAGFSAMSSLSLSIKTCGDLTLESCGTGSAAGLRVEAPVLTEVIGTLRCRNLGKPNTGSAVSFPVLKSVGVQLSLYSNASYLSVIDFPALETVGNGKPVAEAEADDYALQLMPAGCVGGFSLPELRTVKGNALFSTWTAAVTKVPRIACPELTTIEGNLEIGHTNYVSSATAALDFRRLQKAGSIRIDGLGALTDFSTFTGVISSITSLDWSVTNCGYEPTWKDMVNGNTSKTK